MIKILAALLVLFFNNISFADDDKCKSKLSKLKPSCNFIGTAGKAVGAKTDSKLTRWITGKEKMKIPNPVTGVKNVGKAIKPLSGQRK